MKAKALSLALLALGVAVITSTLKREPAAPSQFTAVPALGITIGAVLLAMGTIAFLTAFSRRARTRALLRVDHFLPFLRKKKQKEELRPPGIFLRAAKRVLPKALFSDPVTGKPGLFRKALKRIGPTMLSSPMRRVVQGVCFVVFLLLFFYVLWPYSAEPHPPGQTSVGWRLEEIDQETGDLRFHNSQSELWTPVANQSVHVIDDRAPDAVRGHVGQFSVIATEVDRVTLKPREPLTEEQLVSFFTSVGTWSLHERSPWPSHYTDELADKEVLPADLFLVIDPLVSISTAIAARSWVWSLACAAIILIVCVLIPRGFCGYLCPLGTLIDLFDWAVSKRIKRFRLPADGWWVHIKYYLLMGTLVCALFGVLVSGYVAAIPVITRGMLFIGDPLQSGTMRGWEHLPPINVGHIVSIVLFVGVLGLGLLKPRFWCKYVCPSGAVFSLGNLFRVTERKVESTCINCNKCVEICPFDAIKPDFTTRVSDCTLCQTCAGVCPTHAIKFVERWNLVELKPFNDPPTGDTKIGRRGFVSLAAGTAAAFAGGALLTAATRGFGANLDDPDNKPPVRPPGSVPEEEFLQMCIRCGECFKACPYNVLQPMSFQQGLEGLWTPQVAADHAGCAPSCNACGQVCPTGAIRPLPLAEKKVARMGLAIVNEQTCLPFANREACQLCVDECAAAGYHAIEFLQVHTEVDEEGQPIEGTGYVAPVVLQDKCVGCGLCQMQCYQFNVKQKHLLDESAIIVEAGEGKEDRMMGGSYRQLRHEESQRRKAQQRQRLEQSGDEFYIPDADGTIDPFGTTTDDSPFGIEATEPHTAPTIDADADPFGLND